MEKAKIHIGDKIAFCLGADGQVEKWLDFDDFAARSITAEVVRVKPGLIEVRVLDLGTIIAIPHEALPYIGFLNAIPSLFHQSGPYDA